MTCKSISEMGASPRPLTGPHCRLEEANAGSASKRVFGGNVNTAKFSILLPLFIDGQPLGKVEDCEKTRKVLNMNYHHIRLDSFLKKTLPCLCILKDESPIVAASSLLVN